MRRYFNEWKYKHPTPNDLIRIMEKEADMQLDWFVEHFVYTTNQVDYGIKTVVGNGENTFITMERVGDMMMPVDLYVTYKDGSQEIFYVPLRIMRGAKQVENQEIQRQNLEAWPWTYPTYTLQINKPSTEIATVEIDASQRMADIERANNKIDMATVTKAFVDPTVKK